MKLIVQIPCFNEEQTLAATLADIPREIAGVDEVELLVIDDGSTDGTAAVARECGVHHLVRHKNNLGLASAFNSGLREALRQGADIVVNTDGDNQYYGADIALLIQPILEQRADIVIGDRQITRNMELSRWRKALQVFGSAVVRTLSGVQVPDAVSGFRALSQEAALRMNIISRFSYTTEMIIQAGNKNMDVLSVPVRTNAPTRPSRLFRSVPQFVAQQGVSIVRMYAMYRPMRFFFILGTISSVLGSVPVVRFLLQYFAGDGAGHIQSLVLGGVLLLLGFIFFVTGLLSDLISHNRRLLELTLERAARAELAERELNR